MQKFLFLFAFLTIGLNKKTARYSPDGFIYILKVFTYIYIYIFIILRILRLTDQNSQAEQRNLRRRRLLLFPLQDRVR